MQKTEKTGTGSPKNICIARIDRAGDLILTTPALRLIREAWPKANITLLTSPANAHVLQNSSLMNEIICINKKESLRQKFIWLKQLRKKRLDHFIVFSPINLAYWLCFFSGAQHKTALLFTSRHKKWLGTYSYRLFPRLLAPLFCQTIQLIDRYKNICNQTVAHQTQVMIDLLGRIGIPEKKATTEIPLNETAINKLKKQLRGGQYTRVVLIHLSQRWINPYFSLNDFTDFLKKLAVRKETRFIFTTERDNGNELLKEEADNFLCVENPNFKDWSQHIAAADQVITPECGCVHVASACQTPVTVIYGKNHFADGIDQEYSPWQSPHHKLRFGDCSIEDILETLQKT